MANHPTEFKRGTWYWLRSNSGHWFPSLYNADGDWKIDSNYIPHELFMKIMDKTDIVEAVLPD